VSLQPPPLTSRSQASAPGVSSRGRPRGSRRGRKGGLEGWKLEADQSSARYYSGAKFLVWGAVATARKGGLSVATAAAAHVSTTSDRAGCCRGPAVTCKALVQGVLGSREGTLQDRAVVRCCIFWWGGCRRHSKKGTYLCRCRHARRNCG